MVKPCAELLNCKETKRDFGIWTEGCNIICENGRCYEACKYVPEGYNYKPPEYVPTNPREEYKKTREEYVAPVIYRPPAPKKEKHSHNGWQNHLKSLCDKVAMPGEEYLDHYGAASPWQGRKEEYGAIPELDQIGESSHSAGYYDHKSSYPAAGSSHSYYGGSNQIDTGYYGSNQRYYPS